MAAKGRNNFAARRRSGDAPTVLTQPAGDEAEAFAPVLFCLNRRFEVDLRPSATPKLFRLIRRRMALAGCAEPLDYADRVTVDSEEAARLLAEFLASEGGLLRDRDAFAAVREKVVAPLAARFAGKRPIRVWVAGCGAGDDACALAVAFCAAAAERGGALDFNILATDSGNPAPATGRLTFDALAALPPELAERYFELDGDGARAKDELRRRIVFHRHDLARDPPFARIDLVCCRQALAVRSREDRARALERFRSALNPGGLLLLDSDESGDGFEPVDRANRIFSLSRRAAQARPELETRLDGAEADPLTSARRRLRDLDRRNQTVIEALSETIVSWEPRNERILFSNAAFAEMVETPAADLLGRPLAEALHPEIYRHKREAMAALASQSFFTSLVRAPKPSGEIVWRSMRYTRINGHDGRLVAYLACGRDVSDEMRHVEALEALAALETPIDQPFESYAAEALKIGAGLLGLPHAALSQAEGELRRVPCLVSLDKAPAASLCKLALAHAQEVARRPDDAVAQFAAEGGLAVGLGAGVRAGEESFGAVCFFSAQPPAHGPISEIQRGFVRHVAQWIGMKIAIHRQHLSLRRSEAELRLTFDNVAQNILRLDRSRRVRWANAGAARAMGLDPESVVGAPADAFMQRLDPKWRAHGEAAFGSQTPYYGVEAQFKPKDAAPQWTSTDFAPDNEGPEGEPSLLVVSTDITPLKEREGELEVAIADADHSRRLIERHYRRTPVLLCSFQSDGRVHEASDLWRDKTGYAREDLVGRRLGDFMDEPSRRRAQEALPQLWRTGACDALPFRFVAKSGRMMDVELSGYLSVEDGGAPLCLAVLVDVTARNAAETALERANRELATVNDGLKKFAHVASHDLQEPLRKIRQFGDLLIEEHGHALSADAAFYVDVMRDSSERMRRLIRDILDFSRSINATASRTRLPLADIARDVLFELEMAVREAGAEIRIGRLPSLYGDRTAMQMLMRNLIGNSLKHRRPDVAPQVSISGAWASEAEYVLSFKDNGAGVDPRHHELIFEAFTRLQPRSEADGSGLGLAICKSVCERQQWRIGVNSAPGEGAEFTVAIPAADVVSDPPRRA